MSTTKLPEKDLAPIVAPITHSEEIHLQAKARLALAQMKKTEALRRPELIPLRVNSQTIVYATPRRHALFKSHFGM